MGTDHGAAVGAAHELRASQGKVRTPVEFGHKVLLAESARGLVTQYQVLEARGQMRPGLYGSTAF